MKPKFSASTFLIFDFLIFATLLSFGLCSSLGFGAELLRFPFQDGRKILVTQGDSGVHVSYVRKIDSSNTISSAGKEVEIEFLTLPELTGFSVFNNSDVSNHIPKEIKAYKVVQSKKSNFEFKNWLILSDKTHGYFIRQHSFSGNSKIPLVVFKFKMPSDVKMISSSYGMGPEGSRFLYFISVDGKTAKTMVFSPEEGDQPLKLIPQFVDLGNIQEPVFQIVGDEIVWKERYLKKYNFDLPEIKDIKTGNSKNNPMGDIENSQANLQNTARMAHEAATELSKPANQRMKSAERTQNFNHSLATPDADVEYKGLHYKIEESLEGVEIVRLKDLKSLTVSKGSYNSTHILDGGILKFSDISREISLDHFDAECAFMPTGNNPQEVKFMEGTYENFRKTGSINLVLPDSRKELVRQAVKRMLGEKKNSLLLTEGFGDRKFIVQNIVQALPPTWRVLTLSPGPLSKDINYSGKIQENVSHILEAAKTTPLVLVAEDFHIYKGLGSTGGNQTDVLELIRDAVLSGQLRLIALSGEEFNERVHDPAWDRALFKIPLTDLSQVEVFEFLKNLWAVDGKGLPLPSAKTLNKIIDVAGKFNVTEEDPARSADFMAAYISELSETTSPSIDVNDEVSLLKSAKDFYRLDPSLIDPKILFSKVQNFIPKVRDYGLMGHDHVIAAAKKMIANSLSGASLDPGPGFIMYVDGPPGVGKTEMAKSFASAMDWNIKRIVMHQAMTSDTLLENLYRALKKNPHSLIFLDEIEKASPDTLKGLLQTMDNEYFNVDMEIGDKQKRTVRASTKHAKFMLAGNVLGEAISHWWHDHPEYINSLTPPHMQFIKDMGGEERLRQLLIQEGLPSPLIDRAYVTYAFPPTREQIKGFLTFKINLMIKIFEKNNDRKLVFTGLEKYIEDVTDFAIREKLGPRSILRATTGSNGDFASILANLASTYAAAPGSHDGPVKLRFDEKRTDPTHDCQNILAEMENEIREN